MKASPQLMSCLLVASVALLNSGAASSASQANEEQAKSSSTLKKARLPPRKTKTALKKTGKAHDGVTTAAQAHNSDVPPKVVEHSSPAVATPAAAPAPAIALKMNPYQPGVPAIVTRATPNPYLTTPPPAAVVALAAPMTPPAITVGVPVEAKATPPITATPTAAGKVATEKTPAVVFFAPMPISATPTAPTTQAQPWKADVIATRPTNPYLTYSVSYSQPTTTFNPTESLGQLFGGLMLALPSPAPSMPYNQAINPASGTGTAAGLNQIFNNLRNYLPEPHLPSPDIDILPSITKVYPTGEKPLYVLTFKCPTELIGITPLPTKALRWLITAGMDGINSTNLLSFNMQQVCQ